MCCEECGVMWRVWCDVESMMGCEECDVWCVVCGVESVVCCGKYGVFSVTERKLEDSKRLGFDGIVYKTTHTQT